MFAWLPSAVAAMQTVLRYCRPVHACGGRHTDIQPAMQSVQTVLSSCCCLYEAVPAVRLPAAAVAAAAAVLAAPASVVHKHSDCTGTYIVRCCNSKVVHLVCHMHQACSALSIRALHCTGYAAQQAYAPALEAMCPAGAAIWSIRWLLLVLLFFVAAASLAALPSVVNRVCMQRCEHCFCTTYVTRARHTKHGVQVDVSTEHAAGQFVPAGNSVFDVAVSGLIQYW